jgi:cytoskeletal protein CcmA (bactofilin family)
VKTFSLKPVANQAFLLTEGLDISGNIHSHVPGRIDCMVTGDVNINGKLVIGKNGCVCGNIEACSLILEGKVQGNITCTHDAVVMGTASITGAIIAKMISVAPGAVIGGGIIKYNEENGPLHMPQVSVNTGQHAEKSGAPANLHVIKVEKNTAATLNPNSWF